MENRKPNPGVYALQGHHQFPPGKAVEKVVILQKDSCGTPSHRVGEDVQWVGYGYAGQAIPEVLSQVP